MSVRFSVKQTLQDGDSNTKMADSNTKMADSNTKMADSNTKMADSNGCHGITPIVLGVIGSKSIAAIAQAGTLFLNWKTKNILVNTDSHPCL